MYKYHQTYVSVCINNEIVIWYKFGVLNTDVIPAHGEVPIVSQTYNFVKLALKRKHTKLSRLLQLT